MDPWLSLPLGPTLGEVGSHCPLMVPHELLCPWEGVSWAGPSEACVPQLRGTWETVCLQAGVCGHRGEPPGVLLLL